MSKRLVLVTSGEPGGIGPDICLDVATTTFTLNNHVIIIIGDVTLLEERAKLLNKAIVIIKVDINKITSYNNQKGQLLVLDIPCPNPNCMGKLDVANAPYVLNILEYAINLCKEHKANIIVTAPVSKEVINQSGVKFPGHTEYFAASFDCKKVVMLLANPYLKVALLTTHLALKDVPFHVTEYNLDQTLEIIIKTFILQYGITSPRIGVCGLNPHAGEGGYLGDEELRIIDPVIKQWQLKGYDVSGSYPADTIFTHTKDFDVILAMYHDQGLPVLKYSGFEDGINITLGLPIIRTSVDHGTALNLAGTGKASSKSLIHAIEYAIKLDRG